MRDLYAYINTLLDPAGNGGPDGVEIIAAADPEGRKDKQFLEQNDQAQSEDRWSDDGGQR